jgi:hypothetical protein
MGTSLAEEQTDETDFNVNRIIQRQELQEDYLKHFDSLPDEDEFEDE